MVLHFLSTLGFVVGLLLLAVHALSGSPGQPLGWWEHLAQWWYVPFPIGIVLDAALRWLAGAASRGVATRPVSGGRQEHVVDPPSTLPLSQRWYIESHAAHGAPAHSCSFIEFDERGDYLDFAQHRDAYLRIQKMAASREPLRLVIFVHGWRHSSQSGNVLDFNEFLHQIAAADNGGGRHRVHGVYMAWRGGAYRPSVDRNDVYTCVHDYFGGDIIDMDRTARLPLLNDVVETFSYFDRKSVPEFKFAGTSISRSLFSCADAARTNQPDCEIMLIGHSFGGLMLERTFQNAAIGQLTGAWPWGKSDEELPANPLPFDTVVLVNSAAPSIYAKQFQSYFAAHRAATDSDTPIVFSMTSEADWATGKTHPAANTFARFLPTLRRMYRGRDFILATSHVGHAESVRASDDEIPQWYYYQHTPGHNPLLVNRFIEPIEHGREAPAGPSHVSHNLRQSASSDPTTFLTTTRDSKSNKKTTTTWSIRFPPETNDFKAFSTYDHCKPLAWTQNAAGVWTEKETGYWIIRCPKAISSGHNDIWNPAAMETYAALHRIAISKPNRVKREFR